MKLKKKKEPAGELGADAVEPEDEDDVCGFLLAFAPEDVSRPFFFKSCIL
jgi:hypothetical protein